MKHWFFHLLRSVIIQVVFVTAIFADGQQSEETKDKSSEELIPFSLKPELDAKTLKRIQTPASKVESMSVNLWVGGIDRFEDGVSFLTKLPAKVGVLINPFDALSKDVFELISKQKRPWALVIPTRSRFDGNDHSPATLNKSKESYEFFEQVLKDTRIKIIFIPDMVDVDQEVIEFIISLAKKYGLMIIIPPQFFSNIQETCVKQGVAYKVLDSFAPSSVMLDTFKEILSESTEILKAFGELNIAVMVNDEFKKDCFMDYIKSLLNIE
jgi:hypothetical protein